MAVVRLSNYICTMISKCGLYAKFCQSYWLLQKQSFDHGLIMSSEIHLIYTLREISSSTRTAFLSKVSITSELIIIVNHDWMLFYFFELIVFIHRIVNHVSALLAQHEFERQQQVRNNNQLTKLWSEYKLIACNRTINWELEIRVTMRCKKTPHATRICVLHDDVDYKITWQYVRSVQSTKNMNGFDIAIDFQRGAMQISCQNQICMSYRPMSATKLQLPLRNCGVIFILYYFGMFCFHFSKAD